MLKFSNLFLLGFIFLNGSCSNPKQLNELSKEVNTIAPELDPPVTFSVPIVKPKDSILDDSNISNQQARSKIDSVKNETIEKMKSTKKVKDTFEIRQKKSPKTEIQDLKKNGQETKNTIDQI